MAANTLGLNQIFPIYNEDGTPFHNLVLRKSVVDSIVMSLGDKITGDVFYKDNTLAVTMREYIEYKQNPEDENEEPIRYSLVNPPTIVREGMVADNGELKGMTKYSFEFYHPMYQLSNFPFTDVATKTGEEKYLSQNKSFSWIGKPQDYIDKLNKNLQGTVWYVRKSDRFPVEKDDELSDVQQFDNVSVAEAIKRGYEIWGTPYIVSQLTSDDPLYAQGKRFVVEYGLPSNEIYENESARQLDTPYVFQMGQGVGLKNNSRTPRNNKIVTRIAGYGSEDNVPYGYPQIVWTGNQDWDYTINNDPNNHLSYPIYKGIVGGQYVKLIKHPFTRTHLMPSIFTETVNKKVNPNAVGYDPTIEIKDYYDAVATQEYPYVNEINLQAPSYESHEFADIKPELDADRNTCIVSAVPLNADLTPADHWDDSMDDDGNYLQSYFQITLPQLSFDLYACAAITQEMQINMRSGACIGCTFPVQVDWDDYKKNFYDEDGNFVPDGDQRDLTKYPKSNLGQISVVVQKDNSTFGTLMPNIYQQPKANDLFVFIGISLPLSYITNAEEKLDDAMKTYMLENNVYYFDYPLKFDEHFLATHTYILEQIRPNSIIHFDYGGVEQQLFVKQLTVKYGNAPLPQYDITLTDNVEVVLNQIGQVAEDVEKLSSIISILRQSYNRNVWVELAKKLSKVSDDTAQGFIRFIQGLQVGNQFVTGLLGEGGVFRKEADGTTYLEADKMYIRIKAYFDNVEIRDYKHSAGNRIASPAGAKCCRVEYIDANGNVTTSVANAVKFRCYFRGSDGEDEVRNNFVVGDQAYCHITSVDTKDDDPNSKSFNMKHYWRLIVGRNATNVLTENGEHWIDLSNVASETLTIDGETYTHAGYQSGSDVPAAQDDIIQLGNIYDTDRMGAIVEFVTGADAPSYQIFQGINDFNLNGKNYIGLGYSTQTGRAYINIYGDAYIGDKPDAQGNASSYLKYNAGNRQLSIKARIDATSTIDGATIDEYIEQHSSDWTEEEINSLIHNVTDDIQAQIDGAIDTWFYNGTPSDSVLPESEWKAIDIAAGNNNERLKHLGDIYYDNETGYAYRYSNTGTESSPVFVWNPITDSAVVEALRKASQAQDTADGKRTVYGVWNAWIKDGSNILEAGDLFIPQSDTTQGGVTYKANKVYKCTTKGSATFQEVAYTDDSAFNGYISAILNGSGSSGDAATVAAAQKAIKDALGGGTTVDGGLLLTSLIAMRKYKGSGSTTDIANYDTWSGISGLRKDTETGTGWKGYGIAAWYGGAMVDHEVSTTATDYAKSLFRFDGSGYLAGGNISWDKNGIVTIANVYSNVNGQNVEWSGTSLQYMNNISKSLPLTYQSGTAYFDPKISFTNLSIMGKAVATQEWIGQNYISISFFSRLFRAYNGNTLINANDVTSTIDNIKAMFGFWTEQYISALGQNSGGGGGIVLAEPLQSINSAGLGTPQYANMGLVWNGSSWTYGTIGAGSGTVTSVKVGSTSYSPTNGVVSLPDYLKLSGGTLTDALIIHATNYDSFNEGIRIQDAPNRWAGITFGATGSTGINPAEGQVAWFAAKNPFGQFIISPNTSDSTVGLTLNGGGNLVWRNNVVYHTGNLPAYPTKSSWNYDDRYLRIDTNNTYGNTISFTSSGYGISVGGILGAFSGYLLHLFDRVNIGCPNGWGSQDAPSYGLSVYGGCSLATNTGSVGIATTSPETKLDVNGIHQIYQRGRDNTAFKNLLLLKAQSSTETSGDNWDEAYPTFGIGFRRYWSDGETPYGETTCAGIYATISSFWRGGLVFRTKNNETQGGTHDVTALKLAPSGAATFASTVTATSFVGNASSATKLQTSRTIWGQSFDGSGNVDGALILNHNDGRIDYNEGIRINAVFSNPLIHFGGSGTYGSGANQWTIGLHDSKAFWALTYNSWSNYIITSDTSGNVGIGTASPSYKLSVSGDVSATNFRGALVGNASSATQLQTSRTIWGQSFDGSANVTGAMSSVGNISFDESGRNIGSIAYFDTANGRLGIGSAPDAYKLDVDGTSHFSDDIHIGASSGASPRIYWGDGSFVYIGELSDDKLQIYGSSGIHLMGGSVGVGTTSPSSSYKLDVSGVAHVTTGLLSDGYVTALSDVRLKKIIDRFTLKPEAIALASLIHYIRKDVHDKSVHVGGIAQEWQEILPEAVHDIDGRLTMDYGVIGMVSAVSLAKTVVEQEKRIKSLEERLAAIEAKLK